MKQGVLILLLLVVFSAKAQLSDTFSDGNFTANPTWTGEDLYYQVNAANQLQSNGPAGVTTALSLCTPNTLFQNTEWSFYLKLDFNGTNSNQARVYLMSDQADLEASLNGYFVGVGQDGTADAVRLFRQQGPLTSTPVLLIPGIAGRAAKPANNTIKVKVLRDNAGSWTLFSDTTGTGNNYVQEGTAIDSTITSTAYFGVLSRYTSASSTNRTKFYYDDFLIQEAPLQLLSATAINATQVELLFSAPVSTLTAQNQANYLVSAGIGNPLIAERDPVNTSRVLLTLNGPLTPNTTYTLTVNNVTNLSGIPISPNATATFTYTPPPVAVQPRDVVINEILADESPVLGLPSAEFIELYNTTSQPVNLAGFILSDPAATAVFPSGPASVIAPDSFLIVTATANASLFAGFGQVIGLAGFPSLNNSSDVLWLKNSSGQVMDKVAYTSAWYQDPTKANGGWSLEQINPFSSCSGQSNWRASENPAGGTPGTQNSVYNNTPDTVPPALLSVAVLSGTQLQLTFSEQLDSAQAGTAAYSISPGISIATAEVVSGGFTEVILTLASPIDSAVLYTLSVSGVADCSGNAMAQTQTMQLGLGAVPVPGELIINELFADVNPQVGLPAAEFVELHNTGTRLLKLGETTLSDGSATATLPASVLLPNGYVILTSTTNAAQYQSFGHALGILGFPSLNDSGDSLVLQTATGTVLDLVEYTSAWYQDPLKASGGWTLERKNPNLPCSSANNWSASVNPVGGTPGAQNSVYTTAPDQTAPVLLQVTVASATVLQVEFSEQLSPASVAAASVSFSGSISASNIALLEPARTTIAITLAQPLDSTSTYTLTVAGLQDCSENAIHAQTFTFGIGVEPGFHDLLITEIMADPSPVYGLPEYDFVELYNASGQLLKLQGIQFSDPQSTATLPGQVMQPGEYLVIAANTAAPFFAQFGRVIGVSDFPSLNNTADQLTLRNSNGHLIFSLNYTDDWYKDDLKKNGGWSLEMIDLQNPCAGISNWTASDSPQGGTPAQANSVAAINPDNAAPELIRADVLSPTQVQLTFNESLDSLSAATIGNYSVGNWSSVSAVNVQGPSFSVVMLTLADSLQAAQTYTLTLSGLADCAGNMLSVPITTNLVLPQPAVAGDVILNEVLFNPKPDGVDFVELYNRSHKHIDLKDWKLANLSNEGEPASVRTITALPYVLRPGGYVVLTTMPEVVKQHYPQARDENFLQMFSMPSYPDSEGNVLLLFPDETVADRFNYTSDLHFALIDDLNGVSLERINTSALTNLPSNWQSAAATVGFATPGYRNSQVMSESSGNETITVSPKVFTPDSGGDADFTTISYQLSSPNNTANITVYDSDGREIKKLVRNQTLGTEGFIKWDGTTNSNTKAGVGYYVFYIELVDLQSGEVQVFKEPVVVGARF